MGAPVNQGLVGKWLLKWFVCVVIIITAAAVITASITTAANTTRATWLMTADSSPTPVSDDCVLQTLEHWSSVAHKPLLATEHLLRQHLGSGTVCRLV